MVVARITAFGVMGVLITACANSVPEQTDTTTPKPTTSKSTSHELVKPSNLGPQQAPQMTDYAVESKSVSSIFVQSEVLKAPGVSGEQYSQADTNPVKIVQQDPVSTFSVDIDTASYTNVRRFLNKGVWPQVGSVRIEEMINYFDYQYEPPKAGAHPFSIHSEMTFSPWNADTRLLRIGVKGYDVEMDELPPMNLVFLLDVSGSMNQPNKLPLLKRSFKLLVDRLRPEDRVAIAVYAGASGVVLEPTPGDGGYEILAALDQLKAGGGTNGGAGIELAYNLAKRHFKSEGINRVILATDGDFNVGVTDMDELKRLVKAQRDSGIFLSVLGFGSGNYNDHLVEELSNLGNGSAYYIDRFSEARKVFSEDLTGTLHTIAKDVKIQVEFNPAVVAEYRLIGYDNRILNREDFNNDRVDAGDVGAGHSVTALYEWVPTNQEYRFNDPLRYQQSPEQESSEQPELAYVKLRYKLPAEDNSHLMSQVVKADAIVTLPKASESLRFAASVAGFGELLRESSYIMGWEFENAYELAKPALGKDPYGYRHEFLQLIQNAQSIRNP